MSLLTARCPVAYAPAMHTEMWEHPATQHNVATLRDRGATSARVPPEFHTRHSPNPSRRSPPASYSRRS